jgi:hypothetical protein
MLCRMSSSKHKSPILQYLKKTFTFFSKKVYNMSLIAFMPKCKKEMEQLHTSFLEDFSSREGLLPNWFELDIYAKLLLKRGDSLSEDKNKKEADEAKAERKRVLASKDCAKSFYDNATLLKDYTKRRIDECQKKRTFTLKCEYEDLLHKAKMIRDLGDI